MKFSDQIETEVELLLNFLKTGLNYQQIKDLLLTNEENLEDYTNKFFTNDEFFILSNYFSHQDLLEYTFQTQKFNKKLKKDILKVLTYPIILYVLMYCLMIFFLFVLFPSLLSIISIFDLENPVVNFLFLVLFVLFVLLTIFNLFSLLVIILSKKVSNVKLIIILFSRFRIFESFKLIYTYQFSHALLLMLRYGFSTKQALEIMRHSKQTKLVSWISTLVMYQLEEGIPFDRSINLDLLDNHFKKITTLGYINNDLPHLLQAYNTSVIVRIESIITSMGRLIKGITYGLIAFLIIFMYQILLAPMSLMSNL